MDPNPNTPQPRGDSSRTFESEPKRAATDGKAEVGLKLKEAEAKLTEAEAKLMEATAPPAPPASAAAPRVPDPPAPGAEERTSPPVHARGPHAPVTEQLSENVAGMLCYLFGWVSGLVFLLVDRRPFVRFHAAQSVAVFAALSILLLALSGFFLGALLPHAGGVLLLLRHLIELGWLCAAVVLMLKAASGSWFRVALAAPYADRAAHGAR